MDKMPIIVLLFLAIPEGMLLTSTGLTLVGVKPHLKQAIVAGILYMISAYIIRGLLAPGIHSVAIMLCATVYLKYLYHTSLKKTIPAIILGFVFLVLGELITLPIFTNVFSITIEHILANAWLRVAASLPTQLILLTAFFISYRVRGYHLPERSYSWRR